MLLDDEAHKRIEAAIAEVERSTSGELVVATVNASDDYGDLAWRYCAVALLGSAAVAHVLFPELAHAWLLALQAGFGLVALLAFRAPAILRALVPKQRLTESVERRAREAFLEHELFATRERTGVLIFISEIEHRVVILGDSGIDHLVHREGWQAHIDKLVAAIRTGRAGDGVCEVIRALGETLAEHMPPSSDDKNELPNQVRR